MSLQVKAQKRPGARRRRRMSCNGVTLLWLVLFYPVGLTLMWFWRCGWRSSVKLAVTAPLAALLLAVMLYPDPSISSIGNVTLYGENRSAKIYGPEIPLGYMLPTETLAPESVIVSKDQLVDNRFFVYAADNASCYHLESCEYAFSYAKKMTVYEAHHRGYIPCNLCGSPPYTGGFD